MMCTGVGGSVAEYGHASHHMSVTGVDDVCWSVLAAQSVNVVMPHVPCLSQVLMMCAGVWRLSR